MSFKGENNAMHGTVRNLDVYIQLVSVRHGVTQETVEHILSQICSSICASTGNVSASYILPGF